MTKKRRAGILILLVGISIPSVLFFFQDDGILLEYKTQEKKIKRNLTSKELEEISNIKSQLDYLNQLKADRDEDKKKLYEFLKEYLEPHIKENNKTVEWEITTYSKFDVPFKYFVGLGVALILVGTGLFLFSFFPKIYKEK